MYKLISFCFLTIICFACKDGASSKYNTLDLMSYGMPIKIMAPSDPVITQDDLGIVKEVTVKGGEDFNIQIFSGKAYSNDIKLLVERQKGDAQSIKYYSRMIEEFDNGFIFEKKYPELDDRITYDFRYVKLQGDNQFTFQTGLMGQHTLDQVKDMYNAVK